MPNHNSIQVRLVPARCAMETLYFKTPEMARVEISSAGITTDAMMLVELITHLYLAGLSGPNMEAQIEIVGYGILRTDFMRRQMQRLEVGDPYLRALVTRYFNGETITSDDIVTVGRRVDVSGLIDPALIELVALMYFDGSGGHFSTKEITVYGPSITWEDNKPIVTLSPAFVASFDTKRIPKIVAVEDVRLWRMLHAMEFRQATKGSLDHLYRLSYLALPLPIHRTTRQSRIPFLNYLNIALREMNNLSRMEDRPTTIIEMFRCNTINHFAAKYFRLSDAEDAAVWFLRYLQKFPVLDANMEQFLDLLKTGLSTATHRIDGSAKENSFRFGDVKVSLEADQSIHDDLDLHEDRHDDNKSDGPKKAKDKPEQKKTSKDEADPADDDDTPKGKNPPKNDQTPEDGDVDPEAEDPDLENADPAEAGGEDNNMNPGDDAQGSELSGEDSIEQPAVSGKIIPLAGDEETADDYLYRLMVLAYVDRMVPSDSVPQSTIATLKYWCATNLFMAKVETTKELLSFLKIKALTKALSGV